MRLDRRRETRRRQLAMKAMKTVLTRSHPRLHLALALAVGMLASGCSWLSYPETAPATSEETADEGAQPYVSPSTDPRRWTSLSRTGRDAMRARDLELAEESYVAALAETAAFPIHDTRVRTALGNVLKVAAAYQRAGDFEAADRLIEHVVTNARNGRLADFDDGLAPFRAQALHRAESGDAEGTIALYESLLAMRGVGSASAVRDRLEVEQLLGNAYVAHQKPDEAEPLLISSLRSIQILYGPESLAAARALIDVAAMRRAQDDFEQAEKDYLRSLAIQRRLAADTPELAISLNRIGWFYLEYDRNAEAAKHASEAIALFGQLGISGAPLVATLDTLATAQTRQGELAAADQNFVRALEIYDQLERADRRHLASMLENYATLLRSTGREQLADLMVERATAEREGPTRAAS